MRIGLWLWLALLLIARRRGAWVQVSGELTYNGYGLDEFVPQKTAAYISQNDVHDGEMTVKEVLDFSAKCQGVGQRYGESSDLRRRRHRFF